MSFSATINGSEKQLVWGKCLSTVSQVRSDIIVTVTDDELILSAMNATDTTITKIRFKKQFFTSFKFEPRKIVFGETGVQQITDYDKILHTIYSFKINGKYLALISLKQDDIMQDYVVSIDNTDSCTEEIANKLLVRIRTDSLLSKEYQINFEPLKSDQIILSLKYKQKFLSVYRSKSILHDNTHDSRLVEYFDEVERELQNDMFNRGIFNIEEIPASNNQDKILPSDEINFLSLDQGIFRAFIESIMSNAIEEIKLEITSQKLNIIGFTKAVYNLKSKEYLRQAITVTNTCSLSDLDHYCLFAAGSNSKSRGSKTKQSSRKSIVFKLRDFKIFLNGLSCWKTNDSIKIWFCKPGAPVLFEVSKDDVIIELVQITENDGNIENNDIQEADNISVKKHTSPLKTSTTLDESKNRLSPVKSIFAAEPQSLFVTEEDDDDGAEQFNFKRLNNPITGRAKGTEANALSSNIYEKMQHELDANSSQPAVRMRTTVEWGESNDISYKNKGNSINEDRSNHLYEIKRRKLAGSDDQDSFNSSMGPTQADKPKGLFD